jgi:hypothetical protein
METYYADESEITEKKSLKIPEYPGMGNNKTR